MNNDHDILLAITAVATRCSPVSLQYNHVKGHQDTKTDLQRPLTIAEQHNVECDKLAKQFVTAQSKQSYLLQTPELEAASPHLIIRGKVICHTFLTALRQAATVPAYHNYLCNCFEWTQADLHQIQWHTLAMAINSFPCNDQRRLVLFIHDKLPLCSSKIYPHLGSILCPSCRREPKDYWHFLECDHPDRHRLFENLKTQLTAISRQYILHPSILTTFWLGLLAIRNDTPYPDIQGELPPTLRKVLCSQARLGWDQLYHG